MTVGRVVVVVTVVVNVWVVVDGRGLMPKSAAMERTAEVTWGVRSFRGLERRSLAGGLPR